MKRSWRIIKNDDHSLYIDMIYDMYVCAHITNENIANNSITKNVRWAVHFIQHDYYDNRYRFCCC